MLCKSAVVTSTELTFPQLGRNFGLYISNTTLESSLNTVIKQSPVARKAGR